MAKKPDSVKQRLVITCQHPSCIHATLGTTDVACETWELPVYLLIHHFNHEGHKTQVTIDGVDYSRLVPTGPTQAVVLPLPPIARAPAASGGAEQATGKAVDGVGFQWGV